jgi:hypothetical protein
MYPGEIKTGYKSQNIENRPNFMIENSREENENRENFGSSD